MLYLAAVLIVASVALFVAAPLGGGLLATRRTGRAAAEAERLEHERALAMQGLRELEFDREMGKLSEADYAALREGLMARALGASAALERLRAGPSPGPRRRRQRGVHGWSNPARRLRQRPALRPPPPCASGFARNAGSKPRRQTSAANAARRFPYRRAPRRGPSDDGGAYRGARAR